MNAAVEVVRALEAAGVVLAVDGDRLRLRASVPPPGDLLERLRRHKPEVIALLTVTAPTDDDADSWRRWFAARVGRWIGSGHYSVAEARRLGYGEAQVAWHRRRGNRPAGCGGCGRPVPGEPVFALPDRATVCGGDLTCLQSYGREWRRAAAEGLARLGIEPPEGWEASDSGT